MRAQYKLVVGFLFFTLISKAQFTPDCRSSIPVCGDMPITGIADGRGDIDDFDPDVIRQTGCLEKGSNSSANIENNTSWYVFRALKDGSIGFDISADTDTAEWDFAIYGPDTDCASISNGTAQPVRCNYEANDTAFTGLGTNPESGQEGFSFVKGSKNTYDELLNIAEGEIYYILINNYNTNFDEDPEPFTLTFTEDVDALDCTFRDEFLGLDVNACEGDPDVVLNAFRSPVGPDVASVRWSVDYNDDGTIDDPNLATGTEYTVTSPNTGRYFVEITTASGAPPTVTDDVLISFHAPPNPADIEITVIDYLVDRNKIEVLVNGTSEYEYAINGGEFQDETLFHDVPPGQNTLIVNDKYGCGQSEEIPFLVIGYPKFFTPNGDGVHDGWNVLGIEELVDAKVYIYDRYGKLLKQLGPGATWNGMFNGKKMPESDYWFRMEYAEPEEGIIVAKTLQNHFTLKR